MSAGNHNPYLLEKRLWDEGFGRIMGLDEVGRGCLAGPVVAAGVILRPNSTIPGISDSKKINAKQRVVIAEKIKKNCLWWTVASCDVGEIEAYNILGASLKAMEKCVQRTKPDPDYLLIDGNRSITSMLVPLQTIIKGDHLSASIGAASILAKVYRDGYMADLHHKFPEYGWDKNAGYPTVYHYEALGKYGITPHHRTSFRLGTTRLYLQKVTNRKNQTG